MDLPEIRTQIVIISLAVLTAFLAGCGGGAAADVTLTPPPSGPAATESRAVALSSQTTPTGSLATDEAAAVSLVQAVQTRWTPAVRVAATAYNSWPFVQGPFDTAGWSAAPLEQPPAEYGTVLTSGTQVLARVHRCDLAFDVKYAGSLSTTVVPVPALDALTVDQRSALTLDQFTSNLLSAVSGNKLAVRTVFQKPGQVTIGDSSSLVMEQCDNRQYGSDLPPDGALSVTTGHVEGALIAIPAAEDQIVSTTLSLITTAADAPAISRTGTYFGYYSRRSLVSLVKNDIRVFNSVDVRFSNANLVLQTAEMLVTVPNTDTTGSVPAPTLRVKYDKWEVDLATSRAVAGILTITDSSGIVATIRPVGAIYEVLIKSGSQERAYSVAP